MIVLVLAAIGVGGWALSHQGTQRVGARRSRQGASSCLGAVRRRRPYVLRPVSANSFDALGDTSGDENGSAAQYAIDASPGTFWHTDYYYGYRSSGT